MAEHASVKSLRTQQNSLSLNARVLAVMKQMRSTEKLLGKCACVHLRAEYEHKVYYMIRTRLPRSTASLPRSVSSCYSYVPPPWGGEDTG